MRSDIVPGSTLPDYELPDHENVPRRLSELQGDEPLILTLARGHYCPKEHQQHLELAAFYPKIAVAYTRVVTIATDEHHELHVFVGQFVQTHVRVYRGRDGIEVELWEHPRPSNERLPLTERIAIAGRMPTRSDDRSEPRIRARGTVASNRAAA